MTRRVHVNGEIIEDRRDGVMGWHLEKKFPISLIVFLLFQTGGFIWWASEINSMTRDHERRLLVAEAFENRVDSGDKQNGERLARLEATSQSTITTVTHIESILERQEDRLRR